MNHGPILPCRLDVAGCLEHFLFLLWYLSRISDFVLRIYASPICAAKTSGHGKKPPTEKRIVQIGSSCYLIVAGAGFTTSGVSGCSRFVCGCRAGRGDRGTIAQIRPPPRPVRRSARDYRMEAPGMDAKVRQRLLRALAVVDEHGTTGTRLLDEGNRFFKRVRALIQM